MKMRHLIALVAATALVALTPLGADAATRAFRDAHGDVGSSVDIHRVRVVNGSQDKPAVRITVVQRELRAGDSFDIWLDTNAANPGPEYRADWIADSDSLGLLEVDSFADTGVLVDCPGFRVRGEVADPRTSTHVLIPRPCLGSPHALRVSVRAQRQVGQQLVTDWAPRFRQFYGLVRQG